MVFSMYGALAPKTVAVLASSSGALLLFGAAAGAWTCAWLCPFGFVQDMLHKIPAKKFILPQWITWLRLPLFAVIGIGLSYATKSLFFCAICPPGTIARLGHDAFGIPHFLKTPEGLLAASSVAILSLLLFSSIFIYRPFCNVLCPIGGLYGIFNKISGLVRKVNHQECTLCGKCKRSCPQGLDPVSDLNSQACIRCLECHKSCRALRSDARI